MQNIYTKTCQNNGKIWGIKIIKIIFKYMCATRNGKKMGKLPQHTKEMGEKKREKGQKMKIGYYYRQQEP